MDKLKKVLDSAESYWVLRDSGDLGEERTIAHNELLDALTDAGIEYIDREHAAQIGKQILIQNCAYKGPTTKLQRKR